MMYDIDLPTCKRMIAGYGKKCSFAFKNLEDLENLAADLYMYQTRWNGKGVKRFWLASIARYKILDYIKSHKRRLKVKKRERIGMDCEQQFAAMVAKSEYDIDTVKDLLESFGLSKTGLAVMKLKFVHFLTNREIAAQLRFSETTVANILAECLQKAKVELSE